MSPSAREVAAPTVLDLFCGAAGGWSLGLHRAGYRTVAAAESDPWRRQAFLHNFPGVEMFEDVRAVTAESLRRRLGYLPAVVVGSPPCQDLSAANHRGRGLDGERSGLFHEAIRIVGEVRPVWCAFENSPRLRARGADRLCADLEALGYSVEPLVVGADNLLAPHIRKRCWLVAADADRIEWRRGAAGKDGAQAGDRAAHDPDADGEGQSRLPVNEHVAGLLELPAVGGGADREGLEIGQGERGDACPKLAALERAVGPLGIRWHGGPARFMQLVDGIRASLVDYSSNGDRHCQCQECKSFQKAVSAVEWSSFGPDTGECLRATLGSDHVDTAHYHAQIPDLITEMAAMRDGISGSHASHAENQAIYKSTMLTATDQTTEKTICKRFVGSVTEHTITEQWREEFGQLAVSEFNKLARASIAALGDSVVPQIPEAIGRVMARLTARSLAA